MDQLPNLGREQEMLSIMGLNSMDELFFNIPEDVRRKKPLPLPPPQRRDAARAGAADHEEARRAGEAEQDAAEGERAARGRARAPDRGGGEIKGDDRDDSAQKRRSAKRNDIAVARQE